MSYVLCFDNIYIYILHFLHLLCHVWDFRPFCFQTLVRQKSSLGSHAPALESRDLAQHLANKCAEHLEDPGRTIHNNTIYCFNLFHSVSLSILKFGMIGMWPGKRSEEFLRHTETLSRKWRVQIKATNLDFDGNQLQELGSVRLKP